MKKPLQRKRSQILLKKLQNTESPDTTFMSETFPVVMKKASGVHVRDVDGNTFVDLTACFGVLALGHRPKATLTAIRKQSAKLIHGMGDLYPSEAKIRFLEFLVPMLPFKNPRCILGQSGSEAIEAAMKTALRITGKKRFLVFEGSYHGLSFGALQLTSRSHFKEGLENWCGSLDSHVTFVPFPLTTNLTLVCGDAKFNEDLWIGLDKETNCANEIDVLAFLKKEFEKGDVAAVFCEPIQGRGGERTFPPEFLTKLQNLCRKFESLLVFDEIYTGFGRTGKMFALEHHGVVPDLLCLGKALGGGLPLSVCAGDLVGNWPKSTGEARHTSTFLGHPLACATAHATLKEIRKNLPLWQKKLVQIDQLFLNFLASMRHKNLPTELSFEVRGTGYMKGFWFFRAKDGFAVELSEALLVKGFVTLPSGPRGRVLSFTPSLNIETKVVKSFLSALAQTLEEWGK